MNYRLHASLHSIVAGAISVLVMSACGGGSGSGVVASPVIPPADSNGVSYGPSITIAQGGTYTGNWQSLDPKTPAVLIKTSEPVVIESANIRSAGHLIQGFGLNLTVRNTRGYALNPNSSDSVPGRFLAGEEFFNIIIESSYLEGTSGIYLRKFVGNPETGQTIKVLRNKVRNIDGRLSDGSGGYSTSGFNFVQFVQFNGVIHVPNIEIAWNEVINEPNKGRVEDNISIYKSSGTLSSPIEIHDNYIQGAYAFPATGAYSGGGIMLGDGNGPTLDDVPGYVKAHDNQVVSTGNYGLAITSGHDNEIYRNRVVSSATLADGSIITMDYANGVNVNDANGDRQRGLFFGNYADDNTVGLLRPTGSKLVRSDYWTPDCAVDGSGISKCIGNTSLPDPIDRELELAEYSLWQQKLQAAGVRVGPQP